MSLRVSSSLSVLVVVILFPNNTRDNAGSSEIPTGVTIGPQHYIPYLRGSFSKNHPIIALSTSNPREKGAPLLEQPGSVATVPAWSVYLVVKSHQQIASTLKEVRTMPAKDTAIRKETQTKPNILVIWGDDI